jgi:hypothetical protein
MGQHKSISKERLAGGLLLGDCICQRHENWRHGDSGDAPRGPCAGHYLRPQVGGNATVVNALWRQ